MTPFQKLSFEPQHDEMHSCRTDDGWRIALYRYRPKGGAAEAQENRQPVLLVHGGASTRFAWDLGDGIGFAPWLAARGHDVWTVDLRGRKRAGGRLGRVKLPQWTFDHLVEFDLPAVIRAVRSKTGADSIHYVGHSMGGMIGYCYLIRYDGQGISRMVTLGSSAVMHGVPPWVANLRSVFYRLGPDLRIDLLAKLGALFIDRLPARYFRSAANPDNVDREVLARYLWRGVAAIPSRKAAHFARIAGEGGLVTRDGRVRYFELLHRIETPVFVVAGSIDRLVDVKAARETWEKIGSRQKRWRVLGRAHGEREDYAHGDLLWGRHAGEELFPDIERFLWSGKAQLRQVV
ncbi:MAG: alpha/beta hydrolase [Deltaproteobacteria bacterium]|nr:alpha/beta hydrolase [Deltaproteobacteria bacterium]